MKKLISAVTGIAILLICVSTIYGQETTDTLDDWSIRLEGARTEATTVAQIRDGMTHSIHLRSVEAESKGVTHTYEGIPLYQLIAMVDGADASHPYAFDEKLWNDGYEISIVAADGYAATFFTGDVAADAGIVAITVDGVAVAPRIVGDVGRGLWVRDVVEIQLTSPQFNAMQKDQSDEVQLVMKVNDIEHSFPLAELEASPFYIEDRGSYTTSAGTTYTSTWGGVLLADFLRSFLPVDKIDTITMVALDGYRMSFATADLADTSEGFWILAFKEDENYLPEDPGPFRTIKVGPDVPNIPGHSSVRMIERLELSGEPYREFILTISGLMDITIDRQTMQSGVSCHSTTVEFEHRSAHGRYTGIPLWRLLAYADDPRYAPHHQDSSIRSYMDAVAEDGYIVRLIAKDGYAIELDSKQLHLNDDVVLATYTNDEELPESDWPLILVWDKDADVIPDGIKPIRQVVAIELDIK